MAKRTESQEKFINLSERSVLYQSLKYILLTLNIFIVTTCLIISIIIALFPSTINDRQIVIEKTINSLQNGKISDVLLSSIVDSNDNQQVENNSRKFIHYSTLIVALLVIFNQTLNVFGIFNDEISIILISCIFLAIIGQIGLFALPTSAFILIMFFIVACILLMVQITNINKTILENTKTNDKTFNASYRKAATCESCRNTFPAATKPMPTHYYGSLGRRPQESKIFYPHYHPQNIQNMDSQTIAGGLRAPNKFQNLNMDQTRNIYANLQSIDRRAPYECGTNDRTTTSTML